MAKILRDLDIKNAKPEKEKTWKLADARSGLVFLIKPNGDKFIHFRYFINGRESTLSLGKYPFVSLKTARINAAELKLFIQQGNNPHLAERQRTQGLRKAQERVKVDGSGNLPATKTSAQTEGVITFKHVALEYIEKYKTEHTRQPKFEKRSKAKLERDVFPLFGEKDIKAIGAPEILFVLEKMQKRGLT